MLRVAQAASSEDFTKFGVSPNQRRTGVTASKPEGNMDGELNVIPNPNNWLKCFRPIDEGMAEFIADFVTKCVANGSHIGYSQDSTRTGVFDALKALGSTDPSKINTLVNCDCATVIGAAVYYSGLKLDSLRKLCTWEMEDVLGGSGAFIVITDKDLLKSGKGIRRGDILLRSGHTAVSIDTDEETGWPRVLLDEDGLHFADKSGELTAVYPAIPDRMLKDNSLRTKDLDGNAWYLYSEKGSGTYHLTSDRTYLVICCQRNSTNSSADCVLIVAAHRTNSHIVELKSGGSKASISGLSLTINRSAAYMRVSITCLT